MPDQPPTGTLCCLCSESWGRKVRLNITAWITRCVHVCRDCEPQLPSLITTIRQDLGVT